MTATARPARPGRLGLAVPSAVWLAALLVLVLAPIATAVLWAVRDGWYPVGDNAYFSLRARDVLSGHHPWLGTWSSSSRSTGIQVNNPGPLLFDVLAIPARIDPVLGPMVGTALLASASAVTAVLVGWRTAGATGALVVASAVAALSWSMGSALLVDPWQPHALLLPFLAFVVLAWSAAAGRGAALAGAVGVGSLLVQTHLPYVLLVPVVLLVAGAALVVLHGRGAPDRRRWRRWLLASVAVGALAWAQPVAEQLAGPGEGNLARLARAATAGEEAAVGAADAARVLTSVIGPVPGWGRSEFASRFEEVGSGGGVDALRGVPSTAGGLAALATLLAGLVLAGAMAWRRGERRWAAAAAVLGAALVAGLVTIAILPLSAYGFAVHQVRWLWPLGVLTAALGVAALAGERHARALQTTAVLAVVVLVGASLGRHRQAVGPTADDDAAPVLHAVAPQLETAEVSGPLLLDEEVLRVFEPYSIAVVMELDRHGIEVVVDDEGLVRQLGEGRRAEGQERARLLVLQGPGPALPAGARVLAAVEGLTPDAARTEAELRRRVRAMARHGDVRLTDRGRRQDPADLALLQPGPDGSLDPGLLDHPGVVADAVVRGQLSAPGEHGELLRRWALLARQRDRGTLTVAVAPLERRG